MARVLLYPALVVAGVALVWASEGLITGGWLLGWVMACGGVYGAVRGL